MEIILALTQILLIIYVARLEARLRSVVQNSEERGIGIIGRAYKRAQKILGRAELEEVKLEAKAKYQIDANREKLDKAFLAEADEAYKQFSVYLQKLVDHTAENIVKFEKDATGKLQTDVDAYKKAQIAAIDANIVQIVTQTVTTVLPKTVKPDIQKSLILEALEKAKADKLI